MLIKLLRLSKTCRRVRVMTTRRTQRCAVILRSPFHYKLPKHHIKYDVYTHKISFFSPSPKAGSRLTGLVFYTPYRLRTTRKALLSLNWFYQVGDSH